MRTQPLLLLAVIAAVLTGCEAIGRIFEAGVWVGVIGIVAVIALVGLLISVLRR